MSIGGGIIAAIAVPVVAANVPSYMQFTAAEWAMIIGAIGLVITNWRQGSKTQEVRQAVANSDVKLNQIHEASNSNLTEIKNEVKALVARLEASIAEKVVLEARILDLQQQRDRAAEMTRVIAEKK